MKNYFIIILSSLLILAWCQKENETVKINDFENYEKTTVYIWKILWESKFVWNIEPKEKTTISSKVWWKIVLINSEKWDYINKWDLLTQLDTIENQVNYQSASNIENSLEVMKKQTSEMFDAQIVAMEQKVKQAEQVLKLASTETNNNWVGLLQIEQSKISAETIKLQLSHTENVLKQKENTIYSNAKNAISQTKILLWDIWTFVDGILWLSDKKNSEYNSTREYIWARNSEQRSQTEESRYLLKKEYSNLEKEIEIVLKLSNNPDDEEKIRLKEALLKTESFLELTRSLLEKLDETLENSVTSNSLPATLLDQYKQQNLMLQNNLELALLTAEWEYLLWIKWSIQAIENFDKQATMELDLLRKQNSIADQQYEITQKSVDSNYEIAKNQYNEIIANLNSLKKQKDAELSKLDTEITEVNWNKDMVNVMLENSSVRAPFDWVIIERFANYWQVIWPWTPIFSIWTNKELKVVIYVPESQILGIETWQETTIEISSINQTFTGIIKKISPLVDSLSKKVSVDIGIDNKDNKIKIWSYVNVTIPSKERIWIYVPFNFIEYEFGEAFVYLLKWNKLKKEYIKIQSCNSKNCVVEWDIKEWVTIVKP